MAMKKKDVATQVVVVEVPVEKKHAGMRIIAMQVENVKRVSFARIRPKGNMVQVLGANGSGKSTILDAIDYAISGLGNVPSAPIRTGEKVSRIQLAVGGEEVEYEIERTFTKPEKGEKAYISKLFVRKRMEGEMVERETPQKLLDRLLGAISFDPLEFIRMEAKKQMDTLRKLVTFKVDIDQLEAEKQVAYNQRRDAGRDWESVKARLAAMAEPDATLPEKPIDTAALTARLENAANHNSAIETAKAMRQRMLDAAVKDRETAAQKRADAERLRKEAAAADEAAIGFDKIAKAGDKQAAEVVIAEPIDTAAVSAEISRAQTMNFAIQSRDLYNRVLNEAERAELEWTRLDELVKAKTEERETAIGEAKMPIEKLGIGDGEVIYAGLPFNQASNAEQIRVSVALAIACNPTLRVLRIKDGSLLDESSLEMIRTMAEEGDYQVWIERVGGVGKVGITMVDGEATGDETEQA